MAAIRESITLNTVKEEEDGVEGLREVEVDITEVAATAVTAAGGRLPGAEEEEEEVVVAEVD
jgi:hypothetical protein